MIAPDTAGGRPATFRDPSGVLLRLGNRILRLVNAAGAEDLRAFLGTKSARFLLEDGRIAATRTLDESEVSALRTDPAFLKVSERAAPALVLEHERIPFPSYPYEWAPEMLYAAGELTLDIAARLLEDGIGLKDGTPYNVLFRGSQPVFVDLLSFERRDPGDPTWLPYAQFVRTFLLPLLVTKHFGLPVESILSSRRDGLEPEEVYRLLRIGQKIRPPFVSLVSLPTWLSGQTSGSIYRKRSVGDPERARFIVRTLLKGLRRKLERVRPHVDRKSAWSDYMTANNNYGGEHFQAKHDFVKQVFEEFKPKRVLDVGCNTGHFSITAARTGSSVVAIDYDPVVVGNLWRAAQHESLDILPLVVNLTRPTPAMGWCNEECSSFWDRARGGFDCVMMLAVIHHMLVTERIPLEEILRAAAQLTADFLVIEFVGPEDSMFQRLVRGREHLHPGLSAQVFESACRPFFDTIRSQHLEGTHRWLYLLRRTG